MPETSMQQRQQAFTDHIRDPANVAAPDGVEQRRIKIYNDLIYNNIEGFLSGGFPVLHSIYRPEDWHRLVRSFITEYRCSSPYFLEISEEFINYLMQDYQPRPTDPPFLAELAHYEWVELALDVAAEELPVAGIDPEGDLLAGSPVVSPLVWSLQYQYPVHMIGPGNEPNSPPSEATYLVVFRDRDDRVQFIESNAATARLLELLQGSETGLEVLEALATEMNAESATSVVEFGARMLAQLRSLDVVLGTLRAEE